LELILPTNDGHGFGWLAKAVKVGYPPAMMNLGDAFSLVVHHDRWIEPDFNEARKWYSQAIECGNAITLFQFANFLEKHQSGEEKLAKELFLEAAELGHAEAQHHLGSYFLEGNDIMICRQTCQDAHHKGRSQAGSLLMGACC
jgi:TPR repeat protein